MHWLDWLIVVGYLVYVVYTGIRMTNRSKGIEGYFLANRSLPWWTVGLSVIATQMSASTLVGATGQGYADGMRFIQFYFGLPLAMVILCLTVVPFFYRAKIFTAYEYLEKRFDSKTRTLTGFLFLMSRGLSVGVTVAAPSVVLSIVLGWNPLTTILVMGLSTTLYTMFGGVQAVAWTDVKQFVVIVTGLTVVLFVIISQLPAHVSVFDGLKLAGTVGRTRTVDTTFSLKENYTLWSGLIGGLFLMLSYFGCDQSQVQRYLTARSLSEGRTSLLMSAFIKIPMQSTILLIGVLVFVFYQFHPAPMTFNKAEVAKIEQSSRSREYHALDSAYTRLQAEREGKAQALINTGFQGQAADSARAEYIAVNKKMSDLHKQAIDLIKETSGSKTFTDVNYVFPTFVTTQMPTGVVGLIIAAIFAAAMSASSGELNSLSTTTVIDFYRRRFRPNESDKHYLLVSKLFTGFWGIIACIVAYQIAGQGSLIEVVNKLGSYFYGSILGVFVLAIGTKRATGRGAFWGLIAGMMTVIAVSLTIDISFLWYNVIGCVVVVIVGMALSLTDRREVEGQLSTNNE